MCVFAAAGAAAGAMGGMGTLMGVAQMGLGIASAMASYQSQQQQYQEQVRFRAEQAKQAQETLNQQVAQQQAALNSEMGKAQGEMAEAAIKANKARSLAATAAAERGAAGPVADWITGDIMGDKARFDSRVRYNSEIGLANARNSLKMAERGGQAQLASIPIPTKPSFLPTAIGIGQAVVGGIGTHYKYNNMTSANSALDYRAPA